MATWSDFIQVGSYGGVEFDFVETQDERSRVFQSKRLPYRDGVRIKDKARGGRVTDALAIFVEEDYPGKMNDLIAVIDAGGVQEFVHPIWGKTKALITRSLTTHNADDSIDSATMQLHIEEHTEGAGGVVASRSSVAAKAGAARDAVLAALNAVTLFGAAVDALEAAGATTSSAQQAIVDQAVEDGTLAATLAGAAADSFEQGGDEMSLDEVQAQMNGVLTKCDAVVSAISSFTTASQPLPEQYDLSQAMITLAAATSELADAIAAGLPALTVYTVEADTTLLAWIHASIQAELIRSDSTELQILGLNPWISDPLLLLAGSEVTAYAP